MQQFIFSCLQSSDSDNGMPWLNKKTLLSKMAAVSSLAKMTVAAISSANEVDGGSPSWHGQQPRS